MLTSKGLDVEALPEAQNEPEPLAPQAARRGARHAALFSGELESGMMISPKSHVARYGDGITGLVGIYIDYIWW